MTISETTSRGYILCDRDSDQETTAELLRCGRTYKMVHACANKW